MGASDFARLPLIGESLPRKEDYRFLTGAGNFADDIQLARQKIAVFVRSPHAHAAIKRIDLSAALALPGVAAVFIGEDAAADRVSGLPCGWLLPHVDGNPVHEPHHPILAQGKVRYVGDRVAMVVGDTLEHAKNAAELVEVEYGLFEPVVHVVDAAAGKGSTLHDCVPANLLQTWTVGDKRAVDAAFARAAHVTTLDLQNNRLAAVAMEPRAVIGSYNHASGQYTLHVSGEAPIALRVQLTADSPGPSASNADVGAQDFQYAEDVCLIWASRKLNCAIKWTADRSETFLSGAHGREHASHAEMAMDKDGKFLAMRVRTDANLGAYLPSSSNAMPHILYGNLMTGQYTTPQLYVEVNAWFTNTAPVDTYPGAGRAEAIYLLERLVTRCAWEMKLGQDEIRKRNFITRFPCQTPLALKYDTGDYHASMAQAQQLAEVATYQKRKSASNANGLLRGLGYSSHVDACGIAPSGTGSAPDAHASLLERAEVRIHARGNVTVFIGSHLHGQADETTFAQLVATRLGMSVEMVDVVNGGVGRLQSGMARRGPEAYPARSAALMKALDKIEAKARKIAAHLMGVSDTHIEFANGEFTVNGCDRKISFSQVALGAHTPQNYPPGELEPGLSEAAFHDPANFTFPSGTYICEVEIDPQTGTVRVDRVTAVDDFGTVINPLIAEGQVHGGLVQGIGRALMENCIYERESGHLLTSSFMDYAMPRAEDLPEFKLGHVCTPCSHNPLGTKGCGDAGAIGSPPAVINAVLDALTPLGVKDLDMPASASRVWEAIQSAKS